MKFVLELSGNHNGDLVNCLRLVREAIALKPDSIKFQCFEPGMLAMKRYCDPTVAQALNMVGHPVDEIKEKLCILYTGIQTRKEWWPQILETLNGYPYSCSVFSIQDLWFMQRLGCPAFKIASFELRDLDLIAACAATFKPLTISVNHSATAEDVDRAVRASVGSERIVFLHATKYADGGKGERSDLERQKEKDRLLWLFGTVPPFIEVGLSDHSGGNSASLGELAIAKDAFMIERHLCLPDVITPDTPFSCNPRQMGRYLSRLRRYEKHKLKAEAG